MPSENHATFPDMILAFSEPIKKMTVPKNFKVECSNKNVFCTVSANGPNSLKRNSLVAIPITIFVNKKSKPLLVGMKWNGKDVCETKPEPHPDPKPEPTPEPEPEPTSEPEPEPEPTSKPDPNPECDNSRYFSIMNSLLTIHHQTLQSIDNSVFKK